MLLGCRLARPDYQARIPLDQTIRKITAWPNHANRNLCLNSVSSCSRRKHGTTGARSCHHLGRLARSKEIFDRFFIFNHPGRPRRPWLPGAPGHRQVTDFCPITAILHMVTHSSVPGAGMIPCLPHAGPAYRPTDPISTRGVDLTHLEKTDFSAWNDRPRAIG